MNKVCFKCGEDKPVREFYRHPQMADGYLGKCKECTKSDVRTYWAEHRDTLKQIDQSRRKAKLAAKNATSNAIRDGRLVNPERCSYCGAGGPIEAHHWDYYRPLDVSWLCKRCHRIADMARRDAEVRVGAAAWSGYPPRDGEVAS